MRKIVRLTESDLNRIVKRVISEESKSSKSVLKKYMKKIDYYDEILEDENRYDDENLEDIMDELKELKDEVSENSKLSKKDIEKLDNDIEGLIDTILDRLDSY
jgi:hypothetical protein